MLKCEICGTVFPPIKDNHYISRDNEKKDLWQDYHLMMRNNCMIHLIVQFADAN